MLEEIDGNKECQLISIFKALDFFKQSFFHSLQFDI